METPFQSVPVIGSVISFEMLDRQRVPASRLMVVALK
jgi:hypothetical protein